MLVFGPANCISKFIDIESQVYVYNLTSLKEGIEKLNLIPPLSYTQYNDKSFDMIYAEYIMKNDNAFYELMTKIIYPLYEGYSVYIATSVELNTCDFVAESLQKFIQSRYGILSNNINCEDDLDYLSENRFSFNGLYNLDVDKERLVYLKSNN